jgi:hypothetical protein
MAEAFGCSKGPLNEVLHELAGARLDTRPGAIAWPAQHLFMPARISSVYNGRRCYFTKANSPPSSECHERSSHSVSHL